MMKKKIVYLSILFLSLFSTSVTAQPVTYTVKQGDSMWKIASKYEVGVSEIIASNPNVKNASLIYPGQKLTIPTIDDIKAKEAEVVRLVNIERTKRGLQPVTNNWQLARVARYKSQDMINKNYFSHNSPTYGSPFNMMESFGIRFSAAGENIASGQKTPAEVVAAWMNSPGHRANILSPTYNQLGVGLAISKSGKYYWTQMFIKTM
ncbi:SafA/ExsA family spore coat assembly protein [Clostridium sp. N3C]|uniref:SafA/ExsA family spore coat assembly protein n=1 Tax=Clostridium sp. N3C TaxID=1776758 RepID=UPI001FA84F37|nr:SafA/ExsA family spore coat assembly protein [Clostridium sp. N3C]